MPKTPSPLVKAKQTPIETAEADLAAMVKRSVGLEVRASQAAAALAAATGERRHLMVENDDPDPKALAAAEKACRDASETESTVRDALHEVEGRITSLRAYAGRLKEAEQRATQALQLEAAAEAVDAATARMRHAAGLLGQAQADLAAIIEEANVAKAYTPAIADPARPWLHFLGTASYYSNGAVLTDTLTASEVADRLAGHIVAAILPTCSITSLKELATPHPNTPARALMPEADTFNVAAALADPIRMAAAALRNTQVPA